MRNARVQLTTVGAPTTEEQCRGLSRTAISGQACLGWFLCHLVKKKLKNSAYRDPPSRQHWSSMNARMGTQALMRHTARVPNRGHAAATHARCAGRLGSPDRTPGGQLSLFAASTWQRLASLRWERARLCSVPFARLHTVLQPVRLRTSRRGGPNASTSTTPGPSMSSPEPGRRQLRPRGALRTARCERARSGGHCWVGGVPTAHPHTHARRDQCLRHAIACASQPTDAAVCRQS